MTNINVKHYDIILKIPKKIKSLKMTQSRINTKLNSNMRRLKQNFSCQGER